MREQRDLREDLEICEKATPGPWKAENLNQKKTYAGVYADAPLRTGGITISFEVREDADAIFIAAARIGWPETIKMFFNLQEENTRLRRLLNEKQI